MTSISLPRKVFQGVAKRAEMFRMFDRHAKRPDRYDGDQSATYAGEWFEIDGISYTYMLDILPPLRSAILDRETRPVRAMSRQERLEHIWSTSADDYRGYAGPRWPKPMQGHRTVMLYGGKEGTLLKLLCTLTDDEIAAKLPVHLRHLPTVLAA